MGCGWLLRGAPAGGFMQALVFTVNVLMGSGALAIPFAFYSAGWALGAGVMALVAFLSYVTISYNFEAQVRAFMLAEAFAAGLIRFQRDLADPDLDPTAPGGAPRGGSGAAPQAAGAFRDGESVSVWMSLRTLVASRRGSGSGAAGGGGGGGGPPRWPTSPSGLLTGSFADAPLSDDGSFVERAGSVSVPPAAQEEVAKGSRAAADRAVAMPATAVPPPPLQEEGGNPAFPEVAPPSDSPAAETAAAVVYGTLSPAAYGPPVEEKEGRGTGLAVNGTPGPADGGYGLMNDGPGTGTGTGTGTARGGAAMYSFLLATRRAAAERSGLFTLPRLERIAIGDELHPRRCPVDFAAFDTRECWEINDALLLFGGRAAVWGWNVCNVVFQMSTLWVFTVVLGQTAVLGIPIPGLTQRQECDCNQPDFETTGHCFAAIRLWFCFFAVVNGFLVAQDWAFMARLQTAFAALVYVSLAVILGTCLAAMFQHSFPGTPDHRTSAGAYVQEIPAARLHGFGTLFGVAIFAMLCHSATSLILRQMPSAAATKRVFQLAFGLIAAVYMVMGLLVAFYMGSRVDRVVTLDWSVYRRWGVDDYFGSFIGALVLFFPVLSVTPGFVLRTRALTDSVETFIPPPAKRWVTRVLLRGEYRESRLGAVYRFQVALRMGVVLGATALAQLSYKFSSAVTVAGFAGFTILFLFPWVSMLQSRRMLRACGFDAATPFDDWTGTPVVAGLMAVVGACAFVYDVLLHYVLR